MTKVFYVTLNDREGLYIDNILEYEAGSLRASEVLLILKNVGPYEYDSCYIDEDFSDNYSMNNPNSFQNTFAGCLPQYLEDLEKWISKNKDKAWTGKEDD